MRPCSYCVPLGDSHERRRLIVSLVLTSAVALACFAMAPNAVLLGVASLAVGVSASAVHVIVPYAAELAPANQRGRVVGLVLSGLLMGVLLARTLSGLLGRAIRVAIRLYSRRGGDVGVGGADSRAVAGEHSVGDADLGGIGAVRGAIGGEARGITGIGVAGRGVLLRVQRVLDDASVFPGHASVSLRGSRGGLVRPRGGRWGSGSDHCWQDHRPAWAAVYDPGVDPDCDFLVRGADAFGSHAGWINLRRSFVGFRRASRARRQSDADLRAGSGGARAAEYGLHGLLFHRRSERILAGIAGVEIGRMERRLRIRAGDPGRRGALLFAARSRGLLNLITVMKKFSFALLLTLPLCAAPPKMAVIGLLHSHAWSQIPNMVKGDVVKLVGVAEEHPELVAEAKKLGVTDSLIFSDYNKMLDDVKPDFVWAFVENNRHVEIVKACAARKISVIFEKPLASTAKDAAAIRDIANKSGIYVMTNYQMAWWASNYTARALADTNALGKVYRLRGVVGHGGPGSEGPRNSFFFAWLTDPVKNGAGALMDFGCYRRSMEPLVPGYASNRVCTRRSSST